MQTRILFYVQHLLGIGHLVRAGRIAAALADSFEVLLVVGGELPPDILPDGVSVFVLPPVKAGPGGFSALVHADGRPFTDDDKAARRDELLRCFDEFVPEVVLIEAFPFGRRSMRFELLPLLERAGAAVQRPLVACSVRDILQDVRPDRRAATVELVRRHFDIVLVHGDPRFIALAESFPEAPEIADLVAYTGMVGPRHDGILHGPAHDDAENFDVIVSVGGGAVGGRLIAAALAARPLTLLADAPWLILTGPNATGLTVSAARGVTMRPFAPDLATRLARARVSVSQAGYNTVADLLAANCRAVLVPYAEGGETEQSRRAALLAARGLAVALDEGGLDGATLATAIDGALALPEPRAAIALDGADVTREILTHRLGTG